MAECIRYILAKVECNIHTILSSWLESLVICDHLPHTYKLLLRSFRRKVDHLQRLIKELYYHCHLVNRSDVKFRAEMFYFMSPKIVRKILDGERFDILIFKCLLV